MPVYTCAEITAKVDKLKAIIDALYDAYLGITTGTIESYSFDTGQTKQTVKKHNLNVLTDEIDKLENMLNILCYRNPECFNSAGAAVIVRPQQC